VSDGRMGIYLSSPKTDKTSEDDENAELRFGLSAMQGWRESMEDAVRTFLMLRVIALQGNSV
jgi:protein phosphatase 1G